ncbi:MAG: KH domain-containing protein [Anaerolineae bacterium]|nr:KH domain-containing protein [Anaerolineae bacterium]
MKDLVTFMAQNLVNDPSQVQVEQIERPHVTVLQLRVAPEDMGRVIGKGGRVANAMRTLLRVAAAREGKRVILDIV